MLFIGSYSPRHQSKSVWNSNEEFISERGHILQHLKFIIQRLSMKALNSGTVKHSIYENFFSPQKLKMSHYFVSYNQPVLKVTQRCFFIRKCGTKRQCFIILNFSKAAPWRITALHLDGAD